jgi:aspartate racemase
MKPTLAAYEARDLAAVRAHLAATAQRLADAGCAFFVCPDNTAHIALEAPGDPLALPGLHIAEIVAQQARSEGRACVGLLGTEWTMTGPVYPSAFRRAGLTMRTPDAVDQRLIADVIFDELTQGVIRDASRTEYVRVIADLKQAGCDVVALSCTEIPMLVTPADSPLPTLDSTRLLAHAAVDVALEAAPLPTWRGGPL